MSMQKNVVKVFYLAIALQMMANSQDVFSQKYVGLYV